MLKLVNIHDARLKGWNFDILDTVDGRLDLGQEVPKVSWSCGEEGLDLIVIWVLDSARHSALAIWVGPERRKAGFHWLGWRLAQRILGHLWRTRELWGKRIFIWDPATFWMTGWVGIGLCGKLIAERKCSGVASTR